MKATHWLGWQILHRQCPAVRPRKPAPFGRQSTHRNDYRAQWLLAQILRSKFVHLQATSAASCVARAVVSASAPECSQHLTTPAVNAIHASHAIQPDVIFSPFLVLCVGEKRRRKSPLGLDLKALNLMANVRFARGGMITPPPAYNPSP